MTITDNGEQSFFSSFKKAERFIINNWGAADLSRADIRQELQDGKGMFLLCTDDKQGQVHEVSLDPITIA